MAAIVRRMRHHYRDTCEAVQHAADEAARTSETIRVAAIVVAGAVVAVCLAIMTEVLIHD